MTNNIKWLPLLSGIATGVFCTQTVLGREWYIVGNILGFLFGWILYCTCLLWYIYITLGPLSSHCNLSVGIGNRFIHLGLSTGVFVVIGGYYPSYIMLLLLFVLSTWLSAYTPTLRSSKY